jgi:hypothetical protein
MKKILTIVATAGLLSAFASAAQAGTIVFGGPGGIVPSSCSVTVAPTAPLTATATVPTVRLEGTADAIVVCNDTTKKLDVFIGDVTGLPGFFEVRPNGGTGFFSGVTGGDYPINITGVTPSAGFNSNFKVSVRPITNGDLLPAGQYSIPVEVIIVP